MLSLIIVGYGGQILGGGNLFAPPPPPPPPHTSAAPKRPILNRVNGNKETVVLFFLTKLLCDNLIVQTNIIGYMKFSFLQFSIINFPTILTDTSSRSHVVFKKAL